MNTNPPSGTDAPGNRPERPPFNEISVLFPLLTLYTVGYMGLIAV